MAKGRNRRRQFRWSAVTAAAVAGVLFAIAGASFADNVQNDAATTAGITTITAGGSTTITYRLIGNNAPSGDAAGCNATPSAPVTVTINRPAGVTGSPASLSFIGCGNPSALQATFSSNAAGSYSITHATSGGVTGSLFNNQADFTLTVNAVTPANTAPTLTLPSDINAEATSPSGAAVSYSVGASDAEDNPDPSPSCSPASGSTFPLGTTQVNCSVTDSGGLSASGMFNVTVVDTAPPVLALPADKNAEATGPSGAAVTYTASASDVVNGSVAVNCSPASGSTFPLGETTVNCSATDAAGNTANGSFKVTVVDTTPPVLTLPADKNAEATGPSGAAVTYTASASDVVDGSLAVNCSPASGSTFPLGETTVNCSATDAAGNTANGSFKVTVVDTTPPSISGMPSDMTVEATGPSGAPASWTTPTATDLVDGSVAVNCSPASGSTFPLGQTTVNCSAEDAAGNSASRSFKVTVQDTTPPNLTLPSDITTLATSASGAVVSYVASASDLVDGTVAISCSPASGSAFALGPTTVNCAATDSRGNSASGSFKVSVVYGGAAVRFLQPINGTAHTLSANPDVSTFKAGSTVPVKVQVVLANGTVVQPASAMWITPQKGAATTQPVDETVYDNPATSGASYLWNATDRFHQYNWGSPKNGAGFYWLIGVKLDDGQVYKVYISLR